MDKGLGREFPNYLACRIRTLSSQGFSVSSEKGTHCVSQRERPVITIIEGKRTLAHSLPYESLPQGLREVIDTLRSRGYSIESLSEEPAPVA